MPLLGKDLSTLRNEQQTSSFTRASVVRIGILSLMVRLFKTDFLFSLQAIQELHSIGYISRDVKPGNFAIGLGANDRRLFLFDFGLARKYLDSNKNIIPPRKGTFFARVQKYCYWFLDVGWRGTTRYGSLQAHLKQDLSRKDDVESWFYLLVELSKGSLPWRLKTDRALVQASKMSARTDTRTTFLEKCSKEYDEILTIVDSLTFPDVPPYEKVVALLESVSFQVKRFSQSNSFQIMKTHNYTWDQRYDWEDEDNTCSTIASSVLEDENANKDEVHKSD